MKALHEKSFLKCSTSFGSIGAHDQHVKRDATSFDYTDLAPPPCLRCPSNNCRNAGTCTIGLACLAAPIVRVDQGGFMAATGKPRAVQ